MDRIDKIERRGFLKTLLAALPGVMIPFGCGSHAQDKLGQLLPKRVLGRTGEAVTMLGIGGYHIGWTTERDAEAVIETALAGGVRFFDTAEGYGGGRSEQRYGKYLVPKARNQVFIMTKTGAKDAATAQQHLDASLTRLNTDYLDLWQVHGIGDPDDVDRRIDGGVLDVFERAKASGRARFIGFTGHSNPAAHLRMLERTADSDMFDTCQMPVNLLDPGYHSFIEQVAPILQPRNIALLAMKTLADGRFFSKKVRLDKVQWETANPVVPDRVSVREALHFVWSLPVSVLITGAENANLVREKIDLAQDFAALTEQNRQALIDKVADLAEDGKIEYFKSIS